MPFDHAASPDPSQPRHDWTLDEIEADMIRLALGRSPDIAINHDDDALSMHEANHPTTRHLRFDRSNYYDTKGKENNAARGIRYTDDDVLRFVTNIYSVLLTRGIRGTYDLYR